MVDTIIVDPLPGYCRVALYRDGILEQFYIDDNDDPAPRPGAIVAARIEQVFSNHNRVTVDIGGVKASFRSKRAKERLPGQMVLAQVRADARHDGIGQKPLQLQELPNDAPLPPQSCILSPAPTAIERAQHLAPDAEILMDRDGRIWTEYDIDSALSEAVGMSVALTEGPAKNKPGAFIHISTPPGVAVIDGDSGASRLLPQALAESMVKPLLRQLYLRQIGGVTVIDFPRLSHHGREAIHQLMRDAARKDPTKPILYGWTKAGIYTLARQWSLRPLALDLVASAKQDGLTALRAIRNHHHLSLYHPHLQGEGAKVRLSTAAFAWLNDEGASRRDAIFSELHFLPKFVVTDAIDEGDDQDNIIS